MSKNSKLKEEKNPFLMVLYIIAVLALLGCLVFLYRQIQKQQAEYEVLVQQAREGEELEIQGESWAEEDSEGEAVGEETGDQDDETDNSSEPIKEETEEKAGEEQSEAEPTAEPTELPAEEPTEAPTPEPTEIPQPDYKASVMVLNGTGKDGLAGKWAGNLVTAGYANITPVTYKGTVEEQTVIYAATEEAGQPFLELFPNGVVRVGSIQEGIELGASQTMPAQVDVYIVLGKNEV